MLKKGHSRKFGFDFFYDEADSFVGNQVASDDYEPFESELFLEELREESILVDVGANLGYYTMLAASKLTKGRIISLEPNARNFQILKMNILLNDFKNVELFRIAASHETGVAHLFISERNFGDHQLYSSDNRRIESVPSVTLAALLESKSIRVSHLKVDTQGFDYFVIRGLMSGSFGAIPEILFTEFWNYGNLRAGVSAERYYELLTSLYRELFIVNETTRRIDRASLEGILAECSGMGGYTHANLLCRSTLTS